MSGVGPVAPPPIPFAAHPMAAASHDAGAGALLPEPTGDAPNDAMAMLYACISHQNTQELLGGQNDVATRKAQRDQELKKERDALAAEKQAEGDGSKGLFDSIGCLFSDAAKDLTHLRLSDAVSDAKSDAQAAWNSPQFWKDLEVGARVTAEVAAAVGGACATAVTFGAAAPALVVCAGLMLSAAGTVESNFHVLEKLGVDPKLAGYVGLGLSVAGAAAGGVGGLLASPAQASKLLSTVQTVGSVMNGASGAASVVAGGAHVKTGNFEANAEDARADATDAQHQQRKIQRVIDMIVGDIKDAAQAHRRALASLQGAMQSNDQTMIIAAGGRIA